MQTSTAAHSKPVGNAVLRDDDGDGIAARDWPAPVSGPSHGPLARVFAVALVLVLAAGLLRLELSAPAAGLVGADAGLATWRGVGLGALLVLLVHGWFVVTGRTEIDAGGIVQSGLPARRVQRLELHQAALGGLPGLPATLRLRVKTSAGRRVVFTGATPALRAAFARIAAAYAPGA